MTGAFTIPSRLARTARHSVNAGEARARVIQLYRDWYRSAPEIISIYGLDCSPAYYRAVIRQRFERNRHVTDIRAIDVLVHKSRVDYQETMNLWKQQDHILGILLQPPKETYRQGRTFLQKFYEGRDEDAVVPAASGVTTY